jgi:hypothetical protein
MFSKIRGQVLEVDSHGTMAYSVTHTISFRPRIEKVLNLVTTRHDIEPGSRGTIPELLDDEGTIDFRTVFDSISDRRTNAFEERSRASSNPRRLLPALIVHVHRVRCNKTRREAIKGHDTNPGRREKSIKVSLKTSKHGEHSEWGRYWRLILTIAKVNVETSGPVISNTITMVREGFVNCLDEGTDLDLGIPRERLTSTWIFLTDMIGRRLAEIHDSRNEFEAIEVWGLRNKGLLVIIRMDCRIAMDAPAREGWNIARTVERVFHRQPPGVVPVTVGAREKNRLSESLQ